MEKGLQDRRFISPQKFSDKKHQHTAADDVYAFGLVMWEMMSGCRKEPSMITETMMMTKPQDREPMPTNCPQGLQDLIRHCWRHEAKDRPTIEKVGARALGAVVNSMISHFSTAFETSLAPAMTMGF